MVGVEGPTLHDGLVQLSRPSSRLVIVLAMLGAVVGRLPSARWPLRPDEAGFLLVARAWKPEPDSIFGTYWVDRPPPIIALFKLSDWIGGPYFIRVVAALGAALFVLATAATARRVVQFVGGREADRAAAWAAVTAAALTANAAIDTVAAKGEILGLPLIMASCWLSLSALIDRSATRCFLAGACGVLAVGLKQNLIGGLVFGGVLLVAAVATSRLDRRDAARLTGAAIAGALLPVAVTLGWCLLAGVRPSTLAYVTLGFRLDASSVLASQPSSVVDARLWILLGAAMATGLVFLALWFLLRLPRLLRRHPALTLAVSAMLVVDLAGVFLSGSYWRTYLLVPIAPMTLALSLLLADDQSLGDRWRRTLHTVTCGIVVFAVGSSAVSLAQWLRVIGDYPPTEYYTGRTIGEASQPGDTLVVYGGRADIQWASGLRSPYEHLWSLPMRTLDPDLTDLEQLLTGPDAPTWFVQFARLDTWSESGTRAVRTELLEDYELVTIACGSYRVYHLRLLERPTLKVDCERPFGRWVPLWQG